MEEYQKTGWWKYLDEPMQDLMRQSFTQIAYERNLIEQGTPAKHDYSFVVFSAAKAYEGFLKKVLLDAKMITRQQYLGDRFRLGKSLNPNLPKRYQWDWVFPKLANLCKGETLPLTMWETWKAARNRIFHYFPDHRELISLIQAEVLVKQITDTMDATLTSCQI